MSTVGPADAKAHLSELVDRVEAGETIDLAALQKLAAGIAPREQDAGALVRSMRDSDRYRCSISIPR